MEKTQKNNTYKKKWRELKMANPYLPSWEYIPDGEPRVFGDRIYVYGSHDRVDSAEFCDYKLKVWSAPVSEPGKWICHGDAFHTRADRDHGSDVDWSEKCLYAPDVVEKDGKYVVFGERDPGPEIHGNPTDQF